MADIHSKIVRSYNMSRIKGKNTKPELLVRKFLHAAGFRFRIHVNNLPGKPDIVLPRYKTVIFVHGCFWHGHTHCRYFIIPKTRTEWWTEKIKKNLSNDSNAELALRELGWKVLVIWECELKTTNVDNTLANLPGKIISFAK
jgi:DNA mismatch endonuclease (patch repair protein)